MVQWLGLFAFTAQGPGWGTEIPQATWSVQLKKNKKAHLRVVSCFIWVKMRTIAHKTVLKIALRNCSKEPGRKVSIYMISVNGSCSQTHILAEVCS